MGTSRGVRQVCGERRWRAGSGRQPAIRGPGGSTPGAARGYLENCSSGPARSRSEGADEATPAPPAAATRHGQRARTPLRALPPPRPAPCQPGGEGEGPRPETGGVDCAARAHTRRGQGAEIPANPHARSGGGIGAVNRLVGKLGRVRAAGTAARLLNAPAGSGVGPGAQNPARRALRFACRRSRNLRLAGSDSPRACSRGG